MVGSSMDGNHSKVAETVIKYISFDGDERPEKVFAAFEMLDSGTLKEALLSTEDQPVVTNEVPSATIDDVAVDMLKFICDEEVLHFKDLGEKTASEDRKDTANEKYGELRGKTLIGTGAVMSVGGIVPSVLGKFIVTLDKNVQLEVLTMLCLRIPIIQNTIRAALKGPVKIFDLMPEFTRKTFFRRLPSVRSMITEICTRTDSAGLIDNIDFDYYGKEE
jgi:hypothetical protein